MAEIAVSVACEVAKCLVDPVRRHCGYVIFSDRYVRQLKDELAKLDKVRGGVQRSISDAENNMREIRPDVNRWKNEAENSANKAHGVLDNEGRAKKTCFCGWLPNPKERYCRGRDARKTAQAIQAIQARIPQGTFEGVYLESAPPGLVGGAPNVNSSACDGGDTIQELIARGQFEKLDFENPPPGRVGGALDVNSLVGDGGNTIFKSQASTFQDVMKALYDEKHKVIGVYGPGGVGKTTLLETVEDKLKKEGKLFRLIVKSKVSQNPDVTKIQYDFAYDLGLKDLRNEPSEEGRRKLLLKRLQMDPREKVLIILDDLWAELDLKAIGIPLGNESMKCKLLLASRDKRVLEQRMHADQTFPLKSLEEEEALKLFEKIVGDRLRDDEELKEKAAQVVTKLAGLPLLINSVASTLKCSNVSTWEDMLIKIEDPNNERIVKWSYDHLESEEAKCLFLLCGLIGGTIRVELLLGLGMGLGLFGGFDDKMQSSRNRLTTMLNSLYSFCLLQDGGDGKKFVTIHDLYSEVVVSDVFGDQNSLMIDNNYGSWPKENLEKCWACLVNVGSNRLVELMSRQFTHVKILMLSEQYDMGDCSRIDFTYLRELRVLYLGSMHITSLPSSMEILENLRSLSISCRVEDVANLGKLKGLQILSFIGSKISKLPKELGKLTNLRSLNLSNCFSLRIIEPGALKGLINLEELHMKESFDQWRGMHELAELKSLTKLASLEISISDPKILLKDGDLPFEKLEKFWINVGDAEAREYEGLTTMMLNLEGCDGILSREWVKKNLQKTQCLYLSNLSEFARSPRELCTQGFRKVKYLNIEDSPSIKYVADSSNDLPLNAFGKLESFFLRNLIHLEKICHGLVTSECFSRLKVVSVISCDRLKYLWCLSVMRRLVQLEEIIVWECDSMQSIVTHDAGEDIVSTDNKVELPNVRRLVLGELPKMTSFCTKAEITSEDIPIQVSLPRLESLVMFGLLGLEKILYSEPSFKYNNLISLEIWESKSTSIILKDWILKLPNLESMEIGGTLIVEVVFDLEELKVIEEAEILSRLSTLKLFRLPNLRRMWKQDVQLQGMSIFQNLKKLSINNTGLSFLFSVSVSKCLRELREMEVEDCPNMNAVIVDEEGRDDGMDDIIEFPLLARLSISRCPTEKFFSYPHGKKDSQDTYYDSFLDQKISLPRLETLILHSLGSSCHGRGLGLAIAGRGIWHGELPKSSSGKLANPTPKQDLQSQGMSIFQNLKKLSINNTGLSFLFSVSVSKCLRELREMEVEDCPNMNAVIVDEEGRDDGMDDIIEFPLLARLSISRCPTEKFFSYPHGKKESITTASDSQDTYYDSFLDQKISLPRLETLVLHSLGSSCHGCGLGLAIAGRGIWHGELPKSSSGKLANPTPKQDLQSQGMSIFQNLKKLSINNTGLSFLFSVSVAKCLREIREIEVEDCPNMNAVIVDEEGRDDGIYDIIEFPLLERLSISCCPTEKFFSYPHGKKESKATYSDSFFNEKISLPSLEKLKINSVGSLTRIWHGELPKSSFNKLAKFTCKKCSNLLDVFPSTIMGRMHNLETIRVSKCPSLESLFDFGSLDSYTEQTIVLLPQLEKVIVLLCPYLESLFNWGPLDSSMEHKIVLLPKLEGVVVWGAGRLRHVVMSDSQTDLGFPSLNIVLVHNCSELRYLFPNYTATTLEKLKALVIFKCEQMKEVVHKGEGSPSKAEVMSFPSLTSLVIWWCPNFRAFIWSPTSAERQLGEMIEENDELPRLLFNDMVRFPNLKMLVIGGVQCKELWNNQISDDSFCKLEYLILKDCHNLQHIAPSHMWKRLQDCLEILEVKSCRSIEIIYENDGMVAKASNLRTLDLRDLDNLRHIWQYNNLPNIPFPNLRYVKAVRCSHLDMLLPTFTAKFLGQIKKLVVGSCEDMELIVGHEECEEVTSKTITFSGLTTLRLYNLPKFRSFLPEKYSAEFPSLDVSSRIEPDQGNRSAEESEGEIEEFDRSMEELDREIEEE